MSEFKIGDRVRVTNTTSPEFPKEVALGDVGTIADMITQPWELIEAMYGGDVPLFVDIDGKPHTAPYGDTGWPILSGEVEPYASEDVA